MPIVDRIAASLARVKAARKIADSLQHDITLHRLAMEAVFTLEDCHESLIRIRENEEQRQNQTCK